ncbi:unnamed protein product [Onchocerca ochengi]|uniref:Fibronectin type-III domain-containing protein n=1 Tax=Onchocerca ochengi TaxID=42157 RepID=A0A182DZH6_ONCOC|nr:unnamed protein product [Onchocerca ochengi]
MYLIDLTELQYSTFMCTLYAFNSNGEYGTTYRLSMSMSPFHVCMAANLLPSSVDLLYKGYPSFLVTVFNANARGYRIEHFPCMVNLNSVYRKSRAIKTYFIHSADENMRAQTIIISWVVSECKTILIE